jgi:hypothetical protein
MLYAVYYSDLFDDSDSSIDRPKSLSEFGSFKEPVTVIWGIGDVVLFTVLEKDFYESIDLDYYFEEKLKEDPNMFLITNTTELQQFQVCFTRVGVKLSYQDE